MKTKLTTKNKLKAVIVVGILLVMTAYFVLVLAVMSAGATGDSDCTAGSSWVRIYLHQDAPTPNIYGWIPFTNKCGETWLIPIDPRAFVADLSPARCMEDACQDDPYPWPGDEQ